jgi:hypothetical protein
LVAAGGQGDGVRLWTDFLGGERGERGWSFEGEKRRSPVKRGLVEAFRDVGCQGALVLAELPSRLDLLEKKKKKVLLVKIQDGEQYGNSGREMV